MVFLQRSAPPKPRKRPAEPLLEPSSDARTGGGSCSRAKGKGKAIGGGGEREDTVPATAGGDDERHVETMVSVLGDAGCTLCVPHGGPPSLPADPHELIRRLESRLGAPSLRAQFLSGFSFYIRNPQNLRRILIPASQDGAAKSLARVLLLVAPIQPHIQQMILEKLPEHFDSVAGGGGLSLRDDVARLIVNQFRWLDFLVDAEGFTTRLLDLLSISPLQLKKEIIGSLPEIISDQSHGTVISALERMLQEDSEVVVPVLDSFSNLNLDEQLQEKAVTIALSCIRTIEAEHMPHLLRFLLLSATQENVGRIISQIREQLKFIGAVDAHAARSKKLKGKSLAESTDTLIVGALRSSLRFKNVLCEAILKELKSISHPRDHKVIDVWFLMLIYMNGGSLQKTAEKLLKKKIVEHCFTKSLFSQCLHGHKELVKDYFPSFLLVSEYLLTCKEQLASNFGIYLYISLFQEFCDTYSRQEVLGALVAHIGSGVSHEVSSALETMTLLASEYAEDLIPISSHISGILDYLEGFNEHHLHKVYEVFCHLALSARSNVDSIGSSIANELLMIVRKQVSCSEMTYRRMGIIGTLKIIATFGDANSTSYVPASQKSNTDEAMDLLKMAIDSCKLVALALVLLYDQLVLLLECNSMQPAIVEWIGKHAGDFESFFLADLEGGHLPNSYLSNGIEGEVWMNLDGSLSPVCLNILPLISSSQQPRSFSLQILPSQFSLLSTVEKITNQGSLDGIDALLGCPLHLPSPKYLVGTQWKKLTETQKLMYCCSVYYAINWILELLNAFTTQVVGKDHVSQATKDHMTSKLLKRLRNLVFLEALLNACLKVFPMSLPELQYFNEHSGSSILGKLDYAKPREKNDTRSNPPKKHKRKGSTASEETNGKLRQPTIVDALRKAGAVVSQEVLERCSSWPSSNEKMFQHCGHENVDSQELGQFDISAATALLESQRLKFRPLRVDCLFLLTISEKRDSCCSDPKAEMPLHLYLLRDLHVKLDHLKPPSKQLGIACSGKIQHDYGGMTTSEFLKKVRPLLTSLRKHLDDTLPLLGAESETCEDHWKACSASAGIPDVPYVLFSKRSTASSVLKEVMSCYSKFICLPDLFLQTNFPVLRDLLEAFQPIEKLDNFFSGHQPLPSSGSLEYMYCGVYSFFEGVMDIACSFSFALASEVLISLQSLVNSITMLFEKSQEGNDKAIHVGCSPEILPFLRNRLACSAHKLLLCDPSSQDNAKESKNKGDIIQMVLQMYLKNSESVSDLLEELACSVLPQVPSCRNITTQEIVHGFPTLCPSTFLTWYRVLHEENLVIVDKMVKQVMSKHQRDVQQESVKQLLLKLRQTVGVVVSLINMCKVHDKVPVHALAIKYGGKYVDSFIKVFDFLQVHFQAHNDIIIQMVKELQKATRTIQALCSEAKGSKRTMVTSKVPATKRSMERFLFRVKALLHSTSSNCTFWMGNLKHKDLFGQVVSSQVYAAEDDDNMDNQCENSMEDEANNIVHEDLEAEGDKEN